MPATRSSSKRSTSRREFLGASAVLSAAVAGLGVPELAAAAQGAPPPATLPVWRDLFNGKDLTGWVNVNTAADTWSVRDGMLICSGKPIGVMRSDRMYENFIIHVEWMHLQPGGNSGMFLWSSAVPGERNRLPNGIEIQMLELDYVNQGRPGGTPRPIAYVHGETWGVDDVSAIPDNPSPNRGRSASVENRALGRGNWNSYIVVAVDGVIKMSVNGKFVNGLSKSSQKKGYICMESEGAEIHFRNLKIMELPPGVTTPEQTAKEL
jgi:hypothetical protein